MYNTRRSEGHSRGEASVYDDGALPPLNLRSTPVTAQTPPIVSPLRSLRSPWTLGYAAIACTSLAILACLMHYASYGLDFTDEGFYLNWIATPWEYPVSASQFGFLYHPLYLLVDGDIAPMRQINILLTYGLAWGLSTALLAHGSGARDHGWRNWRAPSLLAVSSGFACAALIQFYWWLPTPSYNSLVLQGLLLGAWALLLIDRPDGKPILGGVLLGLAGAVTFLAKPTSGSLLGLISLASLLCLGRKGLWALFYSGLTAAALMLASAFTINGSPSAFIQRIRGSMDPALQLGTPHTLLEALRLDTFQLTLPAQQAIAILTLAVVALTAIAWLARARLALLALSVILLPCLGTIAVLFGWRPSLTLVGPMHQAMLVWAVSLGLISLLVPVLLTVKHGDAPLNRHHASMAITLLFLSYAFAFGTANNYWQLGGLAAIMWVLAPVALLAPAAKQHSMRLLAPAAAVTQLLAALLLSLAIDTPYRQPSPLHVNKTETVIDAKGHTLKLSQGYADYYDTIRAIASDAGFSPGTPVIDLTGQSPTVLHSLGARPIGQPWIIGGYTRSTETAIASLSRVSCDTLASAWILREIDGPRSLPDQVLSKAGLGDINQHYSVVGTLTTPAGAGGYAEARTQQLLRPTYIADQVQTICQRPQTP